MIRFNQIALLAVVGLALFLPQTSRAQANNCNNVLGECGPFGGNCAHATWQVKNGFWYELEGGGAGPLCNGPKETNKKTVKLTTTSRKKNKFKMSCDASIWKSIFSLGANWETEEENTSTQTCTDECSTAGCCAGPLYEYTRYVYEQRARRKYLKNPKTWCVPCATHTTLCTLRKSPGGYCDDTMALSGFVPPELTVAQACGLTWPAPP